MTRSIEAVRDSDSAQAILDAALVSFGTRGYEATSLDRVAGALAIRKQTVLYWFPGKEALLGRRGRPQRRRTVGGLRRGAGPCRPRVEPGRGNRAVGVPAGGPPPRAPRLVREVGRLGPPSADRLKSGIEPLLGRATEFLEMEMAAGNMRRHDARFLLLSAYSVVIGVATEVEVLRALGMDPSLRSLILRRTEVLLFLRTALFQADVPATSKLS